MEKKEAPMIVLMAFVVGALAGVIVAVSATVRPQCSVVGRRSVASRADLRRVVSSALMVAVAITREDRKKGKHGQGSYGGVVAC